MQEYADFFIQIYSSYTELSKRAVVEILQALHRKKKIFQRLSRSLLLPADISRNVPLNNYHAVFSNSQISSIVCYTSVVISRCIYRFIAISKPRWSLGVIEIKNRRSLDPRFALDHHLRNRSRRFVTINPGFPAWILRTRNHFRFIETQPKDGMISCRFRIGPPMRDLAELRLNSSALLSFSRRRLSRRSLTSRVNYGLCYQPARRLDGSVDAVGRVKIEEGPIGAGRSDIGAPRMRK